MWMCFGGKGEEIARVVVECGGMWKRGEKVV